jgi:hypothetical protein
MHELAVQIRIVDDIFGVDGEQLLVQALRVALLDLLVGVEKGLDGLLELLGEGVRLGVEGRLYGLECVLQ